ncbi:uncharacterized protein [Diadema antillarum]|uniref:uncharacterized protein n=1 Tax=Diadema antillarum TaxID=105358 RepID=UPI003A83625D
MDNDFDVETSLCQSCPTQTYQSQPNCRSCNPCTQCKDGEYEQQPCTGETDTVCSPKHDSTTSTPTQAPSSSEAVQETSSSQSTSTGLDDDSTGTTPVTPTQPEAIAHTNTKDYSVTVIVLAVFLVIAVVLLVIMTISWWRERVKRYAPTVTNNDCDDVQLNAIKKRERNQQPDDDKLPEQTDPLLDTKDVGENPSPSLSHESRENHTQGATGGLDVNLPGTMETHMINTNDGTGPGVVSGCYSARGAGSVTEGQQGRPADPGCGPELKVTAQIHSLNGGEQSQEVPSSSRGNMSDADDPRHAGKTGYYENLRSSRLQILDKIPGSQILARMICIEGRIMSLRMDLIKDVEKPMVLKSL